MGLKTVIDTKQLSQENNIACFNNLNTYANL